MVSHSPFAKNFAVYVTYLRGLAMLHQNHHWQVKDAQFYGNHLLFERLYEDVSKNLDQAAEKCVGHFGAEALNLMDQAQILQKVLKSFKAGESPSSEEALAISLKAEQNFQKVSQTLYNLLKENGELTLGLDDFIMAMASASEDRCYLLKQGL